MDPSLDSGLSKGTLSHVATTPDVREIGPEETDLRTGADLCSWEGTYSLRVAYVGPFERGPRAGRRSLRRADSSEALA